MYRVVQIVLSFLMLSTVVCHAQSLADAARANRVQKVSDSADAPKVITTDDFSGPPEVTIHLVPGTTSTGDGALVAPGRGKHTYFITNLDASKFTNGGVLHLTITVGNGPSEASFDLYPQGVRLPLEGMPNSLAGAHNIPSGAGGKISYRFDHGGVFLLAAEGSWNSKPGDTNNYTFSVEVSNP